MRSSSTHKWRNCWCSVFLPFPTWLSQGPGKCSCKCLALSASKKDLWGLTFSSLTLRAWLSRFQVLRSWASRFQASLSRFWALLSRIRASFFLSLTLSSFILSALHTPSTLSSLHQVLVSGIFVLSQSCQCDVFQSELVSGPTNTMLVVWIWAAGL